MINLLHNWKGAVEINGTRYESIKDVNLAQNELQGEISIKLLPIQSKVVYETNKTVRNDSSDTVEYKIKVRQYMTKKSSPDFDFMAKWNNDTPMPMRVMVGKKLQETKGMVKMELHGDILAEITPYCMCCGKKITNKVSQYFGMGPECGKHGYINPFNTEEELKNAVAEYKIKLQNITWTGWVIKSAIEEEEVIAK